MTARVFCGTFEAEAYWRERDLAKLPAVTDRVSARIVEAMDEMLFAFCSPGDRVITTKRMDDSHVEYLHSIGFQFTHNRFDLSPLSDGAMSNAGPSPSVFDRMLDDGAYKNLVGFLPREAQLEPFAVLPGTSATADRFGLVGPFPALEIVQRVNTKCYSLEMRDRLELPNVGVVVDSVPSFLERGLQLLSRGPFLVKDDYGVSGKGNLLIEARSTLESIGRHLAAQSVRGNRIRFILESYLQKVADFSCQFRIDEDGSVEVMSVQELENNGQAFGASRSPSPELMETLETQSYFRLMRGIGSLMYADGYHGDVCVDSMILEDGLAPLVEINARKSMSLIKHAVDRYLEQVGLRACFTYLAGLNEGTGNFAGLLALLEKEGVLYTRRNSTGVIPLTCGTMYFSGSASNSPTRGRLYVAAVGETIEEQRAVLTRVGSALSRGGVRVSH
jgi:hypothetical protein